MLRSTAGDSFNEEPTKQPVGYDKMIVMAQNHWPDLFTIETGESSFSSSSA
jgi:hypothetical protein